MYHRRSRNNTVGNLTAIYQEEEEEEPLDLSNDAAEIVTAACRDSAADIQRAAEKSTKTALSRKRFRSADANRCLFPSQFLPASPPLKDRQPSSPFQGGRSISALQGRRELPSIRRRQNSISPLRYSALAATTSDDTSFLYSLQSAANNPMITAPSFAEQSTPWSSAARSRDKNFQSASEQCPLSGLNPATARLSSSAVSSGRSRRRGTKATPVGKSTEHGKASTTGKRRKIDPNRNSSSAKLGIEKLVPSAQSLKDTANRSQLFYRMLAMSNNAQAADVAALSQFPPVTADTTTDRVTDIQRMLSTSAAQLSPVYPPLLMQQFVQTMYLRNNAQFQLALQYRQRYDDSTDNSVIGTSKSSSPMTNHVKG